MQLTKFIKEHKLSYQQFNNLCSSARKRAGLKKTKTKSDMDFDLPSKDDLKTFIDYMSNKGLKYQLIVKFLLYTGVRVGELVKMMVDDINLDKRYCIVHGRGDTERKVVLPKQLSKLLKIYLEVKTNLKYLFESRPGKHYSTIAINQMFIRARKKLSLPDTFHPHTFRHLWLTMLAKHKNMNEAKIMKAAGHKSAESTKIYTNLKIGDIIDDIDDEANTIENYLLT